MIGEVTLDAETYGESDEALAAEDDAEALQAGALLPAPSEEATQWLRRMRSLAERARTVPDAKARALLAWMRRHLCPAIGVRDVVGSNTAARGSDGAATPGGVTTTWTDRRVIIFTEYGDTKRYLRRPAGPARNVWTMSKAAAFRSSLGALFVEVIG